MMTMCPGFPMRQHHDPDQDRPAVLRADLVPVGVKAQPRGLFLVENELRLIGA